MKTIDAIKDVNAKFQVIWDLGRKCTYSCTYCPPHRQNKFAPYVAMDELKNTYEFVKEYCDIYDFYRVDKPMKSISFTGGEPTVHPDFFPFVDWAKGNATEDYDFGLTTNGAFSKRRAQQIKDLNLCGTISYHPEGNMKDQVIENMVFLKDRFKVNVMFHKDYFNECILLCGYLWKNGVRFIPRVIGDEEDEESYGVKAGYAHIYSKDQMAWLRRYWEWKKLNSTEDIFKPISEQLIIATDIMSISNTPEILMQETQKSLGRPCCGGRCFESKIDTNWYKTEMLEDTNFKGWNCMVNWYFLYLHQELDLVWTHQTCGVNLDNEMAPLGKISESHKIIEDLEDKFFTGSFPIIKCPKNFCGCGMCISKAKTEEDLLEINKVTTKGFTPQFTEQKHNDWKKEKGMAWAFCEKEGVTNLRDLKQ